MQKIAAAAYADKNVTLYHGDFLHIAGNMESGSVDMVFTDPPFELTGGG